MHGERCMCTRTKAEIVLSWLNHPWNLLSLGCTSLPTPQGVYLWEGFWNGFLLGQTCDEPATARGNHFRTFVCLDTLGMYISCTGNGVCAQEPKMAEIVLSWLNHPWNLLSLGCTSLPTPQGVYLWEGFWNGFLLGQTCEVPATARGNHFRTFVCLENLDMYISWTGNGVCAQEQKQK